MVTYGELTTRAFSVEDRDDDSFVIHGEGYTFYFWYLPELERFYQSKEYSLEMQKDQPRLPSREDSFKNVLNLQDELKVYLVDNPEVIGGSTNLPTPVALSNGIMFKIAKKQENISIDFSVLNDRYYKKCDLLFETLFRLLEDAFDINIENKDEVQVVDHVEGGKNYCASNFFLERTSKINVKLRNETEIPDMDEIVFRERRVDTPQDASGIDLDFPIKNLKVYFEKTERVDLNGERMETGSKDHHMYFTMNFHLFFYTRYGPKADKEEAKIEWIVDEIEKVYCMNFGCEPDLESGTELNFFRDNTQMNPEHYMVVNYFKPSLMFEHYLLSKEDSKEIHEESKNGSRELGQTNDMPPRSSRLLMV